MQASFAQFASLSQAAEALAPIRARAALTVSQCVAEALAQSVAQETRFVVGEEYYARSSCDYDCIFRVTVTRRSAKSVWFTYHGEEKRAKIHVWSGVECFKPFGSYSMAATMHADSPSSKIKA